jgi:hypothetical protein
MARNISSDETKSFIEWLWEEHDIEFVRNGDEVDQAEVVKLWDEFVDG